MTIKEFNKNNKIIDDYLESNFKWNKILYWEYKRAVKHDKQENFIHRFFNKGRHKSKDAIFFLTEITKVDNFIMNTIFEDSDIEVELVAEYDWGSHNR